MRYILYYVCGLLFGAGLTISNMTNPDKIMNFLDVTGAWDPSLLIVMIGAVVTTFIGFRLINYKVKPLFSNQYHLPSLKHIDKKLVIGAAIFGLGWGMAGYCPGPAIVGLAINGKDALILVIGMIGGSIIAKGFRL